MNGFYERLGVCHLVRTDRSSSHVSGQCEITVSGDWVEVGIWYKMRYGVTIVTDYFILCIICSADRFDIWLHDLYLSTSDGRVIYYPGRTFRLC